MFKKAAAAALLCFAVHLFGSQRIMASYFPFWLPYSAIEKYDLTKLTHLGYCFFTPNRFGSRDTNVCPLDSSVIRKLEKRVHESNCKFTLVVGGGGTGTYDPDTTFIAMVANPAWQTNFVHESMKLVREFNFDGIDNDWEPFKETGKRGDVYEKMMREFRDSLDAQSKIDGKKYSLTAAILVSSESWNPGYMNWITPGTVAVTDFFAAMTYNVGANGFETTAAQTKAWTTKHIPKEKMVVGVPFYPSPAEWPLPSGYRWTSYEALFPTHFDPFTSMPDSVKPVGTNSQGTECVEWCYSPYLVREVTSMMIDSGYNGMMSWQLLSDVETKKPHSLLANMSSLQEYAELPLASRLRTLDIPDSSAEALCGNAKWEFMVDSTLKSRSETYRAWVADSRGSIIADKGYNSFDKGVKGTIFYPADGGDSKPALAGVSLILNPACGFPVLNMISKDSVAVVMNVQKDAPMRITLSYIGDQAKASWNYIGKGVTDTVKIPVTAFIPDLAHNKKYARNFTAANTGKISFTLPAPDTVSFEIAAVGINSIARETVDIEPSKVQKMSAVRASVNQKRIEIVTGSLSPASVSIFTLQGKMVSTASVNRSGVVDMSGFGSGVYLLRIETAEGITSKSVLLK